MLESLSQKRQLGCSFAGALACVVGLVACQAPEEAVQVELPVVADASRLEPVTTDLGYEVELSEVRIMVKDFTFAIAGEAHTSSLLHRSYQWLVPDVWAHPGHYQGGDITGEFPGRFLLDWFEDDELGRASLLVGHYTSANFFFVRANESDVASEDDLILGHTALLRGTAIRDEQQIAFLALLDSPDDRQLVGVPFDFDLKENSEVALHVQLETVDTLEGDTLFDGLDFQALDDNSDGKVEISPAGETEALLDAYNLLRRTLQTHDHFEVTAVALDQ